MYRLADHQTSVQDEEKNNGVELEDSTLASDAKGNVLMCPALGHPVGHKGGNRQSCGDRGAFEVFRLSSLILRQNSDCNVEPSQAGQTTEDEEGQEDVIKRCANTKGECGRGGRKAEGDLHACIKKLVYRLSIKDAIGKLRTRSASESSSCPISEDFLRHRAILPSMKSKNRPNGMNPRAAHRAL